MTEEQKQDEVYVHKPLARNVQPGDFVPNEYARTMTLVDSNIAKAKETVANMDWSVNKKGYRQRIISQKYEPEHNNEIWLIFKLNRFVEIKEIQIGFTNFWTVETEVYIEPSSVIVEAAMTEEDLLLNSNTSTCSLRRIDDKGFANFGVTVYGINLYQYNQENSCTNLTDTINTSLNSLQSVKARYIKIRIKNNLISCLDNSPLCNKFMKPRAIGINYCSIMGYDLNNVGNIENTINDLKKETASKILTQLFKGDFKNTLAKVSVDLRYAEYIKEKFENLSTLLKSKSTSHVVGLILQTFVSYNRELGNWIISKCLDIECSSEQVSLLNALMKCNKTEYYERLQIIKTFIFDQITHSKNVEIVERILPYFETYREEFLKLNFEKLGSNHALNSAYKSSSKALMSIKDENQKKIKKQIHQFETKFTSLLDSQNVNPPKLDMIKNALDELDSEEKKAQPIEKYTEIIKKVSRAAVHKIEQKYKCINEISSSNLDNVLKILFTLPNDSKHISTYMRFCLIFIVYGSIKVDDTEKYVHYDKQSMIMEPVHIVQTFWNEDLENPNKLMLLSMIISNLNKRL